MGVRGSFVWNRPGRLATLTLAMFVCLGQPAAQAAQIVGPLWPAASATAPAPKTPGQWSGTAEGKSHRASTEDTRATDGAKGKARGTAPNELPAATTHDREPTPRTSTPAAVVTDTTTSRTPSPEGSSFDASRSVPQKYAGNERTEVFRNPDNTFTARVSPDRVRFKRPDGSWAPIDNTLVPDGKTRWRKNADSLDVRIAVQASASTLYSLAPDSSHQLSFGIAGAAPATAQVVGDTATFPNVFPGADVQLVAGSSGVKESLVLHSPETPTTWIFPFTARGLSASVTDTGDVEFADRSGKVWIRVPHGSMTDSAIDPVSNQGAWSNGVTYRLVEYQGAPALRADLDTAWLRDPARKYPVVVDPTSTIDPDTTFVQTGDHTGNNHFADLLNVGSYDNGVHKAATQLEFDEFEDDFENHFVRGAWLSLYDAFDSHCTPTEVTVSAIASEWSIYTLSYDLNGYPGVKIGARLGSKSFATSPRCLGTHGTANWSTIGLDPATFDQWAHGGTNNGLILTAATNTRTTWKQFAGRGTVNQPYLTIDYSPYGVNWTGAPSWSTVPTALTDGVLQVPVQNWGSTTWTASGYKLHYTQTNAVTGAVLASGTAPVPYTVEPQDSATVPITIARQPAGSQLRITLDMWAPGDVPFSSWFAPTESFTYVGPNLAPQIDGQAPASNVTLGSLTPTVSATGHDPDNYPSALRYEFWVCPSTATAWPTGCTSSGRLAAGVNAWTIPSGVLAYNKSYYWVTQNYDGLIESYPSAPSWFTTVVGQPVITSHLAQNPDKRGYDPEAGNYTTAATDLTVPGAGLPLAVQRTYNSLDPRNTGAFGAGWWSVFDMRATPDADGTGNVVVTYPNGQAVRFGRNLDGTFTAPEGRYATLTPTGTTGYTLVDKDGTRYVFTGTAPTFRIASITNRAGHGTTFTYSGGRLATVTNTVSGRALHLTWNTPAGATAAHVTSVATDPVAGQNTAITATYTYSGDNLTTACLPSLQQECTGYSYTTGAHNRSVVLDAAPSSYWRLSEPADTDSASSEVLQNEGSDTATSLDVTFGAAGPTSTATAAAFDGTSSYVQLPKDLMSGTTFLTVQLWFRTTASGAAQMLFSTGHSPANTANPDSGAMPVLYVGTDNKLHGHFWDGTAAGMASPNPVNDGQWHQVTLTGAIGTQTLYLDGAPIGTTTNQLVNVDPYQFIGAGVFNNVGWPAAPGGNVWSHFQGSIADVAYYPRPLSAIQIASQYEAATTPAALLTEVTAPSGKTVASVVYDAHADRLTEVTDNNGGTWRIGTPTVAGTSAIYRSTVLGSAASNYWRLGDAGGSSAANELARANGVYNNTTLGVEGPFGRNDTTAASFNGTDSHVQLPGGVTSAAVELWFSTTGSGVLLSYQNVPITNTASGDFNPALYVGTDGKLYGQFGECRTNDTGNCVIEPMSSPAKVDDGKWHHAALSTDGVTQTLYVDGKSAGTVGAAGASGYVQANFVYVGTGFIGGQWPAQPHPGVQNTGYPTYFTGKIAEVSYYWGQLKADEVVDHYKAYGSAQSHSSPSTRVEVLDPDGNPLNYTYDPYHGGRLATSTDAMNNLTSYGYDTAGFLHTVTDPNRQQVFTGHDVRGNVVSHTTCQASWLGCATSYYTYFPDSTSTTLTPDPRNDRVTSFRDGRSADAVDPTYATRYTYNTAGNLLSTVGPPVAGSPAGRTTATVHTDGTAAFPSFDGGVAPPELPASTTTPGGAVTSYRYYANGDLAQVTDPAGLVTTYTRDNIGRLLTARQTSDSYPAGLVTSFTYDAAGRQTNTTSPAVTDQVTGATHTAKTTTDYDADGNITSQSVDDLTGTDATRTTTYGYDDANRLTSITQPSGAISRYGYDSFGRRTSVTNQAGTRIDFGFDPAGRQITTTMRGYTGDPTNPSPARDLVLESRAYDPGGRLASTTDSMGRVTRYSYMDDGRLARKFRVDPASTTGDGFLTEMYGYDPAGNLTGVCLRNCGQTLAEGQSITYHRDAGNRVTAIDAQTTTFWDYPMGVWTDIAYDPDDHPVSVTTSDLADLSPVQRTETTDYTYDPLGRLTSRTTHDPTITQSAAVSMVGRWNLDDGKITSAVDAAGGATAGPPVTLAFDGTRYTATKIWTGQSTKLAFQGDGNLVIYRNSDLAPLWASGTAGNPNAVLVAQTDGNLVIYRDSTFQTALWSTATGGNAGARGSLSANGELTISSSAGTPLWSAGTAQTGFNNPGTLSGGAAWSWEPYQTSSQPYLGVKFDGATGAVTTPGPAVDTTKSYTISLWAKASSLGSAKQTLAVQQGRQQPGFALEYQGSKWAFARPTTDTANATAVSAQSTAAATAGVWTHLVGVYDQPTGTMTLYVNGKAQPTAQNTTPFRTTGPLVIGRGFANGAASAFFNGRVSDVRAYSRTLTPNEITALTNRRDGEAGPGQRGLAGSWTLGDGAKSYGADSSGNNYSATSGTTIAWTADRGGSAQFDGATSALQGTYLNASTNYTVAAWVKLNSNGTTQTAVGFDGTNVSGFSLRYDATANRWAMAAPASDTTGAATTSATSTSAPSVGVWTHLAGVYDAGAHQLRLYVNGQPAGTAAYTAPALTWGALSIGRGKAAGAAAQFFNGRISGVQAYQTALSASQIGTLYAGGSLLQPTTTLTTSWTLDQRGLPTSATDPRGNAPGATKANYTTNFTYDEAGQLAMAVNPVVNAETGGGAATPVHPITMIGHNTFGERTEVQDPAGNITVTGYDLDGRPTGTTLPAYTPPGSSTPINATATVAYNDLGQATTATDPLGNQTGYVYDQLGNLVTRTDPPIGGATTGGVWRYTYDTNGERLSTTDPTGARKEATYDYLGRQITGTQLVRQPAGGATLAHTTTFGYDPRGNLATITSPTGVTTSATFDNAGEMVTSTDGAGYTTSYAYANGRLISTIAPDGTSRTRDYDLSGNLTTLTDLDAAGTPLRDASVGYDAAGNTTSITDPTGVTTQLGYDAANRVVSQVEPVTATTNITTTFGYDAAGNRTRVTDGKNQPWLTTYNSWGLPESQIDPATTAYPNLADRTYTIGYDGAAQPVAVTQPGGVTRTRTYDALGNLTRETGAGAEASTTQRDFGYDKAGRLTSAGANTFTYDDRGLLTATSGPSGNSSFTYDGDGQLTARTDAAGTTNYTYDDGNLATLRDPITNSTATYGYNTLGQVSGVTYGTGNGSRTYTYDDLHRLTGDRLATSTNATVSTIGYGYDLADRETSKTTTGFTGASANTYTYDLAGRLATWSNGASTTAYSYDQAGNRTGIGARTLTYNARDQLLDDAVNTYTYTARGTPKTRTPKAGGSAVQTTSDAFDQLITDGRVTGGYTYDALGRLTTRGGTTFAYTGRGNNLASDGAATYSRDPANGLVGANLSGTGVLVDTDLRGDVVGTHTPAATSLSSSVTYDPLGNRVAGTGQRLGYQSGYTDLATGQVNMAARWYSPDTGQFASRDTVTNSPTPVSGNANRYAYANNNPLTGTDPTGHWPCWECVIGGGIVGGIIGGVIGAAAGCLVAPGVGCVGGGLIGFEQGMGWGAAAGVAAGAGADLINQASSYSGSSSYSSGGSYGGSVPYPGGHALGGGAIGSGLGLGGNVYPGYVFPPIFRWIPPPPPPPTPLDFAHMFAAHPAAPVLGVGSGVVVAPIITAPVTTVVTLPALPDTMFTPSDVATTTLIISGVVAGGTGMTATPTPPHLPNQPSALDLFNTTVTANDLMQCDSLAECAMAALGLVPGEALLGTVGHQGSHSGSLPDFALSCTHSFPGETRVLMADGTTKAIKDVKVGDQVANAQPDGRTEVHRVEKVHVTSTDTEFTDLTITTPQGERTITSTQNHPYWDATTHQFVTAANLRPGHELQTDGGTATVGSVRNYATTTVTYDLTINGVHTYYVVAGTTPALVHNCDPPAKVWIPFREGVDDTYQGPLPTEAGIAAGTPLEAGNYHFIIREDGSLRAMENDSMWTLNDYAGHTSLGDSQGVIMAGTFKVGANGEITKINNFSGHYKPEDSEGFAPLLDITRTAFQGHGWNFTDDVWIPFVYKKPGQ